MELLQNNGPLAPWHARLLVRISGAHHPRNGNIHRGPMAVDSMSLDSLTLESLTLGGVHSDAAGGANGFVTSVGDDFWVCALVVRPRSRHLA